MGQLGWSRVFTFKLSFVRCPRRHSSSARGMKTRSATKAQRVEEKEEEAAEPLPLLELSPEVLNLIAEALAADEDVLWPEGHLNHFIRSCKVIKVAVNDALDKLKVKYTAARALVVKFGYDVDWLRMRPTELVGTT